MTIIYSNNNNNDNNNDNDNDNNNDNDIDTLKNEVRCIQIDLNNTIRSIDILQKKLNSKRKLLLDICPHTNKIRKRDDGPYGERYWFCDKCGQEF